MKKVVFLLSLFIVPFFTNNSAFAGKVFNGYYHRVYLNEIVEDLWSGKIPDQDLIFTFLDVMVDWPLELYGFKSDSLDEILKHYRAQFHSTYQHRYPWHFEVRNEALSANVDRFIDFMRRLLIFNTYSPQTIAEALQCISYGNGLLGD